MNRSRIVTLVVALAVAAVVGTGAAQESDEPEQQEEIREIVIEIGADVASAETAEQLANAIREEVEAAGEGNLSIYVEQVSEEEGAAEPLDRTVTLEFTLQEASEPVSVTTVWPEYAVNAQWSTKVSSSEPDDGEQFVEEHSVDVAGIIDVDDENDTFLVTCWGSFMEARWTASKDISEESADEESEADGEEVEEGTFVDFQASALFRPNQTRVIASRGSQKLELTVTVDIDD